MGTEEKTRNPFLRLIDLSSDLNDDLEFEHRFTFPIRLEMYVFEVLIKWIKTKYIELIPIHGILSVWFQAKFLTVWNTTFAASIFLKSSSRIFLKEFKHSKKNRIDKKARRWFFSRNAPSQWDVFRLDCWPVVELCSLSRLFETRIKQKTNPKVRIQNNIKPNATFCFVRFALRILLLDYWTE